VAAAVVLDRGDRRDGDRRGVVLTATYEPEVVTQVKL
jgi:hypothetical protein